MSEWILPFAEARLFFRTELMRFAESIQEPDLFLTHQYWPPINSGQIFLHEMQLASNPRTDDLSSFAVSGHRVYIAYGGVHEQYRKRAESVANRINDHLRTHSEQLVNFEKFTMQVRSFKSLRENIVSFDNVFCIDGFYATLRGYKN